MCGKADNKIVDGSICWSEARVRKPLPVLSSHLSNLVSKRNVGIAFGPRRKPPNRPKQTQKAPAIQITIIPNESYCFANPRNSLQREIWVFL